MTRTAVDAHELRRAFDESFAAPQELGRRRSERFLAIRVLDDAYALRMSEVEGVLAGRKIVPLPSPLPQLLGLAGNRGVVVPVYDLGMVMGYAGGARSRATSWILLAGGIGFANWTLDGYVELEGESDRGARQAVEALGALRAIVEMKSITDAVRALARPPEK